jgi:hypothetical protein
VTKDEALEIARGLVVYDIATPEEVADAIFKAWSDGLQQGDVDGYGNGYSNGYTDGFKDAGRVGE